MPTLSPISSGNWKDWLAPSDDSSSDITVLLPSLPPLLPGRPYLVDIAAVQQALNFTSMLNLSSLELRAGGSGRLWVSLYGVDGTMLQTIAAVATNPLYLTHLSNFSNSASTWSNAFNATRLIQSVRILGTSTMLPRLSLTFSGNTSGYQPIPTPTPSPTPPPSPTPNPTPTPIPCNQSDANIDLRRWMGYDAVCDSPYPPPKSALDWSHPRRAGYLANYKDVLNTMQRRFTYRVKADNLAESSDGVQDVPDNLQAFNCPGYVGDRLGCWKNKKQSLVPMWVYYNATYKTAFAYKAYVDAQRAQNIEPQFPRYSNWSFVPGMRQVATWTQEIIQSFWDIQWMDTTPTTCYWDGQQQDNFNCLGMFATNRGSDAIWWQTGQLAGRIQPVITELFPILVHFAHLYDTPFLRLSRQRVQAAFRARWDKPAGDDFVADLKDRKSWLRKMNVGTSVGSLAIASASICATFMLRSEAILKARGEWNDQTDRIASTDIPNGRFTNEFLLSAARNVTEGFLDLHRKYGLIEYQTDYTQDFGWGLDTLPVVMTYAPSREVYVAAQELWSLMWRDAASNYNGKIGDTSAPSHRAKKDLVTGNQLGWEQSAQVQYVLPLFKPFCQLVDSRGCAPSEAERDVGPIGPAIYELGGLAPTLQWYSLQAAQIGYSPLSAFEDTILQSRAGVASARFNAWPALTRYNFITTNYTIGHAGADQGGFGESIVNMVKLTGMPTQQMRDSPELSSSDKPIDGPFATPRHMYFSPNMITIQTSNTDEPYSRGRGTTSTQAGPYLPGGWGLSRLLNNPIHSQYQSFELLTFLATDRQMEYGGSSWADGSAPNGPLWYTDTSVMAPPLATELLVPIFVDEILLNGEPLSKANGTCVNIPIFPNPVLTIRHQTTSVVVRLLLSEHAEHGITHLPGSVPTPCSRPEWGQYPFSLTWRVDNTSFPLGNGRFVVAHRNAGDRASSRTFHSAWFMAAGQTASIQERQSLETLVKEAVVKSTTRNSTAQTIGGQQQYAWGNFNSMNWGDWQSLQRPPWCEWNVSIAFQGPGGAGNLSVSRTDIYGGLLSTQYANARINPLPSADIDQLSRDSFLVPPIFTTSFTRRFNGTDMKFRNLGDGTLDYTSISDADYFQPHLPLPPKSNKVLMSEFLSQLGHDSNHPAIALE